MIPCFNDGLTLPDAVASARAQEPAEIVVVNDGSDEPRTLAALDELRRDGVAVVDQRNQGLSGARMAGLRATRARYVFPLDADDLLEPGALTGLADALDTRPGAVAAWGDVRMFGEVSTYCRMATQIDPWWISHVNEIPGTSLLRRESLLAVGGWQLNQGGYEDWDLWMSFAERGAYGVYVPGPMLHYRIHTGRMWATAMQRHDVLYDALRARHPLLFTGRHRGWRESTAPWRLKLLLPLISALPMVPQAHKFRLNALVNHPLRIIRAKVERSGWGRRVAAALRARAPAA